MFAIYHTDENSAQAPCSIHTTKASLGAALHEREGWDIRKVEDLEPVPMSRLVAVWNHIAERDPELGYKTVSRFSDHTKGAHRLWNMIVHITALQEEEAAQKQSPAPAAVGQATKQSGTSHRKQRGINLEPKATVYPCRQGTKQSILVDLLSRPQGATLEQLSEAMAGGKKPWLEVTVRSGLNWDMNKLKGYGIRTEFKGDTAVYHLTYPEGMTAPLPHTPRKS